MNKLKFFSFLVFGIGCVGYALVNLMLVFASDFVYKYNTFVEKTRNFFGIIFLIGLVLVLIVKYITARG